MPAAWRTRCFERDSTRTRDIAGFERRIIGSVARSQPIIDEWTPVHFSSGVLMALVGLRPLDALLASAAWEVLENVVAEAPGVKEIIPRAGAETVENALFDIVVNMIGYGTATVLLGDRERRRGAGESKPSS
jgi:hypothetical protein